MTNPTPTTQEPRAEAVLTGAMIDERALLAAQRATTTAGQIGDLRSTPVPLVVLRAAITAYQAEGWRKVGVTVPMPGSAGGFSFVAFKSSDVPVGTPLFAATPNPGSQP